MSSQKKRKGPPRFVADRDPDRKHKRPFAFSASLHSTDKSAFSSNSDEVVTPSSIPDYTTVDQYTQCIQPHPDDVWLADYLRWLNSIRIPGQRPQADKSISALIDQALDAIERAEADYTYHARQAEIAKSNAAAHRAILRELEALIPAGGDA